MFTLSRGILHVQHIPHSYKYRKIQSEDKTCIILVSLYMRQEPQKCCSTFFFSFFFFFKRERRKIWFFFFLNTRRISVYIQRSSTIPFATTKYCCSNRRADTRWWGWPSSPSPWWDWRCPCGRRWWCRRDWRRGCDRRRWVDRTARPAMPRLCGRSSSRLCWPTRLSRSRSPRSPFSSLSPVGWYVRGLQFAGCCFCFCFTQARVARVFFSCTVHIKRYVYTGTATNLII